MFNFKQNVYYIADYIVEIGPTNRSLQWNMNILWEEELNKKGMKIKVTKLNGNKQKQTIQSQQVTKNCRKQNLSNIQAQQFLRTGKYRRRDKWKD